MKIFQSKNKENTVCPVQPPKGRCFPSVCESCAHLRCAVAMISHTLSSTENGTEDLGTSGSKNRME